MPSPFPGMDPFIESCRLWEDFHQNLIHQIQHAITNVLPEKYVARAGERYYVVLASPSDLKPTEHMSQADVGLTYEPSTSRASPPNAETTGFAVETDEAVVIEGLVDAEYREAFVEIYALEPNRELVTTIEVLSPSNKRPDSPGRQQYLRKRQAHLEGYANLVELDLLRGGQRMPMAQDWPASPYYVLACRKKTAPRCTVWPAHCTRPLPSLRIPLAPPDDDIVLDTHSIVATIYERSRYAVDIDYRKPCHPPLDQQTANWLTEQLNGREGR